MEKNNCANCNDNCLQLCQASYSNGVKNNKNIINYSFTMNGITSCSHGCAYCSAARTLNYAQGVNKNDLEGSLKKIDEKTYSEFKADFAKCEETFEHNSRFRLAKKRQEEKGIQAEVHIDLWGGDPITNHLATQECVDFLTDFFVNKHGMKLQLNSSTGGLPLARNDIRDYYIEKGITLQLSHDGCGQWMRTGDIDPLYDDRIAPNVKDLFHSGNLNMINDCLNFYNNSVFANKKYFDDYFKSIDMPKDKFDKLYIKLNRIYDGDYDIHKKNVHGYFGSDKRVFEELKGREFGDMRHHNWKDLNSGNLELDHLFAHELDAYMNEWLRIAIMMRDPKIINNPMWKPYISYLSEQVNRWHQMASRDESYSICRRFQRTTAKVGDPESWCKPNEFGEIEMFVIDTIGKYCECNLIDSDHHVANIGCATEPAKCKYCNYYLQSECMGCGSEVFTEDCEWRYRWVSMLEQVKYLDTVIQTIKDDATKLASQNAYKQGYNKGREDERVDTGAAIVTSVSQLLGLPGYNTKSNKCNCKGK